MLSGKRIVVSGASAGIGEAIARTCAEEGAIVGIGYHRGNDRAAMVAEETGGVALGFDVRDEGQIAAAIDAFCTEHGHIDGWVNNAAINLPGLLVSSDAARVREQLEVNLLGTIVCTQQVLPHMMKRRSGVILSVSSVAAERPTRGQAVYAASKAGVEAFTRAIAIEYAKKGIRALCLRPGAVDTPMLASSRVLGEDELMARIPQRRIASAAEVADYAAFLLSDRASYITGSVATIDGGYSRA